METDVKTRNVLAVTFGIALLTIGGIAIAQQPPTITPQGSRPLRPPTVSEVPNSPSDPLERPDPPRIDNTRVERGQPTRPSLRPTPAMPADSAMPGGQATREAKPDEMTIDQLLEAVETLRTQKEAMEKKEKAMLKALRQKAEKLNQRIANLEEVGPQPQVVPQAIYPATSR